jgi:hypothetical protein
MNGMGITAVDSSGGTYGRLVDSGIKIRRPKYASSNVSVNSCNSSLSNSSIGGGKYSSHYHSEVGSNKGKFKNSKGGASSSSSSTVGHELSADKDGVRGGGWFQDVTHVIHARKVEDLDFSRVVCWMSTGYGLQGRSPAEQEEVWDFHLMKSPEFQQAINEAYNENK